MGHSKYDDNKQLITTHRAYTVQVFGLTTFLHSTQAKTLFIDDPLQQST